ncbi:MAG: hypothetical protein KF773_23680 [Deltaproteobacteria bacterium]|nr:hypothetical protein [Deltaproteobacteria bacterium]
MIALVVTALGAGGVVWMRVRRTRRPRALPEPVRPPELPPKLPEEPRYLK